MTENKKTSLKEVKKVAHKMLLEEKDVRYFAKIAGFKKGIADKVLKENADPGRGATWDPMGTDNRFENLKESEGTEEVKLEEDLGNTKPLTKPQAPKDSLLKQKGKQDQLKEVEGSEDLNEGDDNTDANLNEGEEDLQEDLGNTKPLTKPQAPKDSLLKQKGKQDQLKEASRLRKENKGMKNVANTLQKEAFGDNEPEMVGDIGAPDMPPSIDAGPENTPSGLGDVSALVAALAQVIQQHTRCFNRC